MFQVHRTDTGQFVLIDPATGVVVIEDELQAGYDHIEALAAERPAKPIATPQSERPGPDSAFEFRGRRSLILVLTIGLPFVWLLFVYLALRDLDRPSHHVEGELEALQAEVASLRSELGNQKKPRGKPKRSKKGGAKSSGKPALPDKPARATASERKPAEASTAARPGGELPN